MAIKSINQRRKAPYGRIVIDLTGPDGNAFSLFGLAEKICKESGIDPTPIILEMMAGDYEHLVATLERHFGNSVVFYRSDSDIT